MLLGSFILQMQSENDARLLESHGRLLHAGFLNWISEQNQVLGSKLHDALSKDFSITALRLPIASKNHTYYLQQGMQVEWRVNALCDDLVRLLSDAQKNHRFRFGAACFDLQAVYGKSTEHSGAGITSMDVLLQQCTLVPAVERIKLDFVTPTSFRSFDNDYPFPKPGLVFGSLAERWNSCYGSEYFVVDKVKQIADDYLIPDNWQGGTKRVQLTPQRGVTGFVGSFAYRLNLLPKEYQQIFLVLAEFAYYSGIGRLTGQGMGQVKITYK